MSGGSLKLNKRVAKKLEPGTGLSNEAGPGFFISGGFMTNNQELTAPFIIKESERRVAIAPVLVPNEPDSDGDVVTPEKIETEAINFMLNYGNVDLQHSLNNVGKVVFNEVTRRDETHLVNGEPVLIQKGSWLMGVHFDNDEVWQAVKDGRLGGLSIMAVPMVVHKAKATSGIALKEYNAAAKRITLADLMAKGDFVVNAVSVVDNPAVPKAKWVALKCGSEPPKGSFDYIRMKVRGALEATFQVPVWIKHIFSDNAIFNISNEGDPELAEKNFRISYVYTADKELVTLIGEPEEVSLETVIVPKRSREEWDELVKIAEKVAPERLQSIKAQVDEADIVITKNPAQLFHAFTKKQLDSGMSPAEQEGLAAMFYKRAFGEYPNLKESAFRKIASRLFGGGIGKESMTFSGSNFAKLKQLREMFDSFSPLLDDMLKQAEAERERKGKKSKEGGQDMTKEEMQALMKESLADPEFRGSVKSAIEELEKDRSNPDPEPGKEGAQKAENGNGDGEPGKGKPEDGNPADPPAQKSDPEPSLADELKALKDKVAEQDKELTEVKGKLETTEKELGNTLEAVKGRTAKIVSRRLPDDSGDEGVIKSDVDAMGRKKHHKEGLVAPNGQG